MVVATVHVSEFLHLIHRVEPAVPAYLAEIEVRAAATELCARAPIWLSTETFALTSNGQAIPLPDFPVGQEVLTAVSGIKRVTYGPDRITLSPVEYGSDESLLDADGQNPSHFFQEQPDTISVSPFKAGDITIFMWLKPAYGFDPKTMLTSAADARMKYLPAFLLTHHAETIANGALSRILSTVGTDYSNPQAASMFSARFEMACDAASSRAFSGQQRAPLRVPASWI